MSIASKLQKLETDISNAYDGIEIKEGTIPLNKNTENLKNAILSIPIGSKPNIFIQDNEPEGYDGIWIADSTYENYPIVSVLNSSSTIASSINIIVGSLYHTKLIDDIDLYFYMIYITDNNNNIINNVNIYYGNGSQWNLVKPYIQLEYIESSGSQYIDTLYNPKNTTKIEMEGKFISKTPSLNYISFFGSQDRTNRLQFSVYDGNATSNWYGFGNKGVSSNFNLENTRFKLTEDGGIFTLTINNIDYSYNTQYSGNFIVSYTLRLFGNNNQGNMGQYTIGQLFAFKIWEENILIRDYIPVKDKNNVACLYDKVSDTFFYNAGSGSFIAGPEI